ncbi:hypothetical protein B0H11DRAFT_818978 [Mycena galericulata]|nr:hypothetical protein B0H11DRAFT_818978 [Mycena galericulata]
MAPQWMQRSCGEVRCAMCGGVRGRGALCPRFEEGRGHRDALKRRTVEVSLMCAGRMAPRRTGWGCAASGAVIVRTSWFARYAGAVARVVLGTRIGGGALYERMHCDASGHAIVPAGDRSRSADSRCTVCVCLSCPSFLLDFPADVPETAANDFPTLSCHFPGHSLSAAFFAFALSDWCGWGMSPHWVGCVSGLGKRIVPWLWLRVRWLSSGAVRGLGIRATVSGSHHACTVLPLLRFLDTIIHATRAKSLVMCAVLLNAEFYYQAASGARMFLEKLTLYLLI